MVVVAGSCLVGGVRGFLLLELDRRRLPGELVGAGSIVMGWLVCDFVLFFHC